MYFKKEFIDEKVKNEFLQTYFAEFALSYFNKVKNVESADLGIVTFEHNGIFHKKALVRQKSKSNVNKEDSAYVYIDIASYTGKPINSAIVDFDRLRKADEFKNVIYTPVTEEQFKAEFPLMSEQKIKEAAELMSAFCNLKSEGEIYSRNGDKFTYKIIENDDITLGSVLLLDELRLYKDDELVGYLKTKYTTLDIAKELLKKDYSILDKSRYTKEEKQQYLSSKNIAYTPDNFDIIFKLNVKIVKSDLEKLEKEFKIFNKIATIDYSNVKDDYQGLGIGTQMYLKIAEHYDQKGISFRSSSLQSNKARGLWERIKREYPSQVELITINDIDFYKLSGTPKQTLKVKSTVKMKP